MLFELLATMCAGLFAGAAIYITFVEHPARLECGTDLAATEFGPSYRRATLMQASLAAVGLLAALVAWAQGRGVGVLIGGLSSARPGARPRLGGGRRPAGSLGAAPRGSQPDERIGVHRAAPVSGRARLGA